ncbi:hypothetical protein JHK85_040889 [Glycine max]|nr:hypothetical protein JHK85_040889 [Glycine max]
MDGVQEREKKQGSREMVLRKRCRSNGQWLASSKDYLDSDRIRRLPNDIICHIYSFLSTIDAVKTSVFSTRWRSLWTRISTLYLHKDIFGHSKTFFASIVSSVLDRHKVKCIKRLSLSNWSKSKSPSFDLMNTMISTVLFQNHLKEIHTFEVFKKHKSNTTTIHNILRL